MPRPTSSAKLKFLTGTLIRDQRLGVGPGCGCHFVKRAARQVLVNPRAQGRRQDAAWTAVTPGKPDLTSPAKGMDFGLVRELRAL